MICLLDESLGYSEADEILSGFSRKISNGLKRNLNRMLGDKLIERINTIDFRTTRDNDYYKVMRATLSKAVLADNFVKNDWDRDLFYSEDLLDAFQKAVCEIVPAARPITSQSQSIGRIALRDNDISRAVSFETEDSFGNKLLVEIGLLWCDNDWMIESKVPYMDIFITFRQL